MEADTISMEALMVLLKNARDENRLRGLRLLADMCKKNNDDDDDLSRVYKDAGPQYFDRRLRTGLGKEATSSAAAAFQHDYLHLSIIVLARFCRDTSIASSKEMVSRVPLILEAMPLGPCSSMLAECCKFLFLVSRASDAGAMEFYKSGGMDVLVNQMPALSDESLNLAVELAQLIIKKVSDQPSKLIKLIASVARQFAAVHYDLKFKLQKLAWAALSHLSESRSVEDEDDKWPAYVHVGVVAVLRNPVEAGRDERLQALTVAQLMMILFGDEWLINQLDLPDIPEVLPPKRSLFLVLGSSRIELHVLLNEIKSLKREASSKAQSGDTMQQKLRSLDTCFFLLERINILISNLSSKEGLDTEILSESDIRRAISDLNETVDVLLYYLKDAKENEQKKGDDLIASVRLIGMCIAHAPSAIRGKVIGLFEYMLSVEGRDKSGPWCYTWFILQILREITKDDDGCKALVSCGGHKAIMRYLGRLITESNIHGTGRGCDQFVFNTVVNILLKRKQLQVLLDESTIVDLLVAIGNWTEYSQDESSDIIMASCLCALLFHFTSENDLERHPKFDKNAQAREFRLMKIGLTRSLAKCGKDADSEEKKEGYDLEKIIVDAYAQWSDQFPSIKNAVERQQSP